MQAHWKRCSLAILVLAVCTKLSSCCEETVEWTCESGDCLAAERVCDGTPDCRDGSDEMAEACLQTVCEQFSFRCAYGACVPGAAECNGKPDCADGSDEAEGLCRPDEVAENSICTSQQFQCDSGTCISQDDACNGQPNCGDNSDETPKACSTTFCPAPYFRCGYGACISADKKCNGNVDCFDKSDESSCEIETPETTSPPEATTIETPTTKAGRTTIRPPFTTASPSKSSCSAPEIKHSILVYANNPLKLVQPGDEVPSGQQIKYLCMKHFYREGQESNQCLNGVWQPGVHPICTRYCSSEVLNGVTFGATCKYDNAIVDCSSRIKPGTIAETFCRTKYRIPDLNPTQRLLCEEDGEWDYLPSRCEPVCGEEVVESVPFAVNGVVTNITAVPWHVAIYSKFGDAYKHNCGGTILNSKVVITAAHCFWDNANEKLYHESFYLVGAGKSFRNHSATEPRAPQFRNISRIAVPNEFKGGDNNFRADIALLILTFPLRFSAFIAPICIRWETGGAKSLASDTYGQVAGWGKDETGGFSEDLKTTFVPMSSYADCRREAGPRLADAITDDKFCILNKYNQNVCEGDSGGGFVVKKPSGEKSRFYLWGIVSNGVPNSATCSNYQFVNYLNIQYYEDFVYRLEVENRPR